MPSITRRSIPALALVVVGVAGLVAGVFLFPDAGDPTYAHSVDPVAESEIPDDATVTAYASLSPEAQVAVRKAVESEDGYYAVHREADKPPEFVYSDHVAVGQGIYFVRYHGQVYRLTTAPGGGLGFLAYGIKLVLGTVGFLTAVAGGVSLYRGWVRPPLAVWGGLAGVLVALPVWAGLGLPFGLLHFAAVAPVAFAAAAALTYRYAPVDA
ncbi:MAG: hypothetical protein ABEJ78_10720 [Haloferacaceae archaeon]